MPPLRPRARACASSCRAFALAVAVVTSGCGGSGSGGSLATMGMPGSPSVALVASNLVFVSAEVNGEDGESDSFGMLIDSGSPVVLLDPTFFGQAAPANANEIEQKVNLGLLDAAGDPVVTVDQVPVLELSNAMMDALGFAGIIGGTMLRDFSVQLDYAAPMMDGFCLGCTASTARTDVGSQSTVPFKLKGGGRGPVDIGASISPTLNIPATRIPLTVNVEGVDHPFILDTGASFVSVRTTLFDTLTADGRTQLPGFAIQTVNGSSNASVTRAKSLILTGVAVTDPPVTVTDPPVMTIPGDALLDGISQELDPSGRTQIDGLLGGSFLRNFLVTIDYPKGTLVLQPYATPPIADEFRRVGITLGLDPTGLNFDVDSVYPGTDAAAKGVMPGDIVVAIDGTNLKRVDYVEEADALLEGTPGTTKLITFGTAKSSALSGQTASFEVEDLLPNP